jgi:predicted nucleic acid-binding protein
LIVPESVLLDTDVLVEYLRGSDEAGHFVEGLKGDLIISAITVAELWAGVKGKEEESALDRFLLALRVIAVDNEVGKQGGLLRQQFGPSHGTGLADALVAASAMKERATLVTFNTNHFPMEVKLRVPYARG